MYDIFIHSSVDGHLACIHVLAIVNTNFSPIKLVNRHLTQKFSDTILPRSSDFTQSSPRVSLAESPSLVTWRPTRPPPGAVVSPTLKGEVTTDSSIYLPRGGACEEPPSSER